MQLFCPSEAGLCEGTLTIRAKGQTIASRDFNQSGGARFPLTLTLSSSAQQTLRSTSRAQD